MAEEISNYYSEDAVLSGEIADEEAQGANENGVYDYMRHFALNDPSRDQSNLSNVHLVYGAGHSKDGVGQRSSQVFGAGQIDALKCDAIIIKLTGLHIKAVDDGIGCIDRPVQQSALSYT